MITEMNPLRGLYILELRCFFYNNKTSTRFMIELVMSLEDVFSIIIKPLRGL
jgi:hypothetical protein